MYLKLVLLKLDMKCLRMHVGISFGILHTKCHPQSSRKVRPFYPVAQVGYRNLSSRFVQIYARVCQSRVSMVCSHTPGHGADQYVDSISNVVPFLLKLLNCCWVPGYVPLLYCQDYPTDVRSAISQGEMIANEGRQHWQRQNVIVHPCHMISRIVLLESKAVMLRKRNSVR